MRVLLVDDEEMLVRTIKLGWPDPDDEIISAGSFAEAQRIIFSSRLEELDCIVLDLQLPDASGTTILSEIRKLTTTPVIMLSAWGDTQFRADLISEGADDYVMKPVGVRELHARAQRLTMRNVERLQTFDHFEFGPLHFDSVRREIAGGTQCEALTRAESQILTALASAQGAVVSRQDLYRKGFGRDERHGEKSLETYIGRLRQKLTGLGDDGSRRILTERGRGYRLVMDASEVRTGSQATG